MSAILSGQPRRGAIERRRRVFFSSVEPPDPWFARAAPTGGIALPDLAPLVRRAPELLPLVAGDEVLVRGRPRRGAVDEPPRFSDPLWARFVARVVREGVDADVAVVRHLQRRDDVAGPLTRPVVEGWLPEAERVRVVALRGDALLRLVDVLAARAADPRTPPDERVETSGLVLARRLARGRPIEAHRRYRVAITDGAAALPAVAPLLPRDDERPSEALRPLATRRVYALGDGRGGFDDAEQDELLALLLDDGAVKRPEWTARVDELSASASAYGNAPGDPRFARSRETRLSTPNLFSAGLAADVALVFDRPSFAWENRLRAQYQGLFVQIEGVPPQETLDDVVLSTEGRVGPLLVDVPLVPFARGAVDSEWTATPDRTTPGARLPHQLLLQESVGLALRPPSGWLKDARVGVMVQEDASDLTAGVPFATALHYDAGPLAGLALAVPLGGATLTSETDVRWFVPDFDDRPEDLGLRVRSVERLRVPLGDELAVYAFLDLFGASSKTMDAFSGSVVVGAGLTFARVYAF